MANAAAAGLFENRGSNRLTRGQAADGVEDWQLGVWVLRRQLDWGADHIRFAREHGQSAQEYDGLCQWPVWHA